jgi:ABC-2 type transport system ATP-binding protein
MNTIIDAHQVSKKFGHTIALNQISFQLPRGKVVGLVGPNGAGKTTLLKAVLGLTSFEGNLSVCGIDPRRNRRALMEHICFIADVAILPKWIDVAQAIAFVEGVHPKFSRSKAENLLAKTKINIQQKVSQLSKGMKVQLHLALILAIDVELLILDEPTLGLDIASRKMFYNTIMEHFQNQQRSIIITTHQIDEVQQILDHLLLINQGSIALDQPITKLHTQFLQLICANEYTIEVQKLNPIYQSKRPGESIFIFENIDEAKLAPFGKVSSASLSDIFVAKVPMEVA